MFKYFRDADNFSFKIDGNKKCSICGDIGNWFSAEGYSGENEIECICNVCLANGELKSLGIEANEAVGADSKEVEIITYMTPALPTWQDHKWPQIEGEFGVFEKIASKKDFQNKVEFLSSFSEVDTKNSDLEYLWVQLPETKITNLQNGNYNQSVYLFTINGNKFCIWDAN